VASPLSGLGSKGARTPVKIPRTGGKDFHMLSDSGTLEAEGHLFKMLDHFSGGEGT